MKGLLSDTLERTAKVISRRAGVRLIVRGDEVPRTDGKVIYLPALGEPCPPQIERMWHGILDHECGHALWSEFVVGRKFRKKMEPRFGSRAFDVLNAIEDVRIETRLAQEYPGSADNLNHAHAEMDRRWRERLAQGGVPLWNRAVAALIDRGQGRPITHFGGDAVALVEAVDDLVVKASRLKSTRQAAELAEKILLRWAALTEPTGQSQALETTSTEKKVSGSVKEEGSVQSQPQSRSDARNQPTESGGDSRTQEDTSQEEEEERERGERERLAEVAREALAGDADSAALPSLGEVLQQAISETRTETGQVPYRVFDRSKDIVEVAQSGDPDETRRLVDEVRPQVSALRSKLLMTLKAKKQRRLVPDEDGARLNRRRLHTLLLDPPKAPLASKIEDDSTDVALSLLVDLSGSMRGARLHLAQQCSLVMAETLSQLGIPFEVIGFSTCEPKGMLSAAARSAGKSAEALSGEFARIVPARQTVLAAFGETFRRVRDRFATMAAQSATPLNDSILFAGRRLATRREKRRILVCLTDGQPYSGHGALQHVVEQNLRDNVQRLGQTGIEVVAVGMMTDFVRHFFSRHIVVENLNELPAKFLALMWSLLGRRARR